MYRNELDRRLEWCRIHTRRKDWWRIRSRISHVFPLMREAERTGFSDQIPNIYPQGLVFLESFFLEVTRDRPCGVSAVNRGVAGRAGMGDSS